MGRWSVTTQWAPRRAAICLAIVGVVLGALGGACNCGRICASDDDCSVGERCGFATCVSPVLTESQPFVEAPDAGGTGSGPPSTLVGSSSSVTPPASSTSGGVSSSAPVLSPSTSGGGVEQVDRCGDASTARLAETITVYANGTIARSVTRLARGRLYLLRAVGTVHTGGPGTGRGDAEYAPFEPPQTTCLGDFPRVDIGIAVNHSDGSLTKRPDWGPFSPSHVYQACLTGDDDVIALNYRDCAYGDNSGSLTVEIQEFPY